MAKEKSENKQMQQHQIENLCTAHEMTTKAKRQPNSWKKILTHHTSDKRLICDTQVGREGDKKTHQK